MDQGFKNVNWKLVIGFIVFLFLAKWLYGAFAPLIGAEPLIVEKETYVAENIVDETPELIESAIFFKNSKKLKITFKEPVNDEELGVEVDGYIVEYTDGTEEGLWQQLKEANIPRTADTESAGLGSILFTLLPVFLIIGIFVFFFMRMQGGAGNMMNFAKSKAKVLKGMDVPKVRFSDVAGVPEAIAEAERIKSFLSNPEKYKKLGARIPNGLLLAGPPGTGKTLLARAIAGEAGVPFINASASDFIQMFVGVGASRVHDLFEKAKDTAPSIIFIDEIDAVGRNRGAGVGHGNDEREQTLNKILNEMDGFEGNTGVIVVAATNRPDVLDPALMRPGRFDKTIILDAPDRVGRKKILEIHSQGKPFDDDIDLEELANQVPGFTGADLENLVNEAALLAAERGIEKIGQGELQEAIDIVIAGPEKKARVLSEEEQRAIAYHETGHALTAYALPDSDPVHKISITSRGRSLGHTQILPDGDSYLSTRNELFDRLVHLIGGRVAEELVCKDISTGASNDIEKATQIARAMVTQYGMSAKLGPLQYGKPQGNVFLGQDLTDHSKDYSDETAHLIDEEVRELITIARKEARAILDKYSKQLHRMVDELMENETVTREEIGEVFHDVGANSWQRRHWKTYKEIT